jgi:hypothetical protein
MACNFYEVNISASDLTNATGNTDPSLDGVVIFFFTDCGGSPTTAPFDTAGTYYPSFCIESDSFPPPRVRYYENDSLSLGSSSVNIVSPCDVTTPTPTETPTQTPTTTTLTSTPTPTPTKTPTPTTPCLCTEYDVIISQLDIDDATGNTGDLAFYNGNIVINYTDCSGDPRQDLSGAGTAIVCANSFIGVQLTYYKNNLESLAIYSEAFNTFVCCGASLTPTPTQTPTQTRTPTPTQTITPTITSSPTTTPTQTPSHTPTNFPIEYSPNGFSYDFILNKLFISTSETKRVVFDGKKTAINFLSEINEILTVNITENGFKLIGLSEGSGQYVLVSDSNGVMYYAEAPGGNVEQTSFISITGGTVIDNVWYFIGDNNSGSVEIVEIYGSDANINEDRTVALGPYSLIYSGSNANQFKLVNTNEGASNTIESGSGDTVNFNVDVNGNLFANSKSFLIKNIDKEGYNLRHGSLEGPENGVYFRGKTTASYIITPLEWEWLVNYDTITVILTSNCGDDIYVKEINSTMITIGGNTCEYSYVVYGERKDIDKMNIDIEN